MAVHGCLSTIRGFIGVSFVQCLNGVIIVVGWGSGERCENRCFWVVGLQLGLQSGVTFLEKWGYKFVF